MEGVLSGKGWGKKDRQRKSKERVESRLECITSLIPRGTLEQELDHKIGPTLSKVVFCALLLHHHLWVKGGGRGRGCYLPVWGFQFVQGPYFGYVSH